MIINKYCDGCMLKHPACSERNIDGSCPCTNYIVKTMCKITCYGFNTWDKKRMINHIEDLTI